MRPGHNWYLLRRPRSVLVVLEHQALGRVPIQGVVGSTYLNQFVELAKEVELLSQLR